MEGRDLPLGGILTLAAEGSLVEGAALDMEPALGRGLDLGMAALVDQ